MKIKDYITRGARYILKGVPSVIVNAEIRPLQDSLRLNGKKVIVTGGGRGLGFAMAKKFIAEGATVMITGRNEDVLKRASKDLGCRYAVMDMQDIESFGQFVEEADRVLDGLDCLVNNAGVSLHETSFFDVTPESWDKQFDTNLKGPFFLTQKFIEFQLRNRRKSNVLFISSETGDTADFRPYGFTKGAVNSMVKGLAYMFRQQGVRVNAVAPGVTVSDMTGVGADGNLYAGSYGEGRFYVPEEVAEVACFMLSPVSGCVSGQIITCNNAQTINARWK